MNIEIATSWACEKGMLTLTKKLNNEYNLDKLLHKIEFRDAINLATKLMTKKQYIELAIYSAELVLHVFEAARPNDARPRQAIEAAKKVLEEDTEENRSAASYAAYAAYAAYSAPNIANAAYAAAANASAFAANASAFAADAARAANAAARAANIANAANAADAARAANTKAAIINKCIEILGRKGK